MATLLMLAVLIGLSVLSYNLLERPLQRRLRRWASHGNRRWSGPDKLISPGLDELTVLCQLIQH